MGFATTAAVLGVATSAYQTVDNINRANSAKKQIENAQRQTLENPAKNIQISTEASEQQTKANLINVATSVEALRRSGTREVLGGIPRVTEASILAQDQISQDLDIQARERDYAIAAGEERLQAIREQRERDALLGLGQELNAARQNIVTGIGDFASSTLAFRSIYGTNPQTPFGTNTANSGISIPL